MSRDLLKRAKALEAIHQAVHAPPHRVVFVYPEGDETMDEAMARHGVDASDDSVSTVTFVIPDNGRGDRPKSPPKTGAR